MNTSLILRICFAFACTVHMGLIIYYHRKARMRSMIVIDRRNTKLSCLMTRVWIPLLCTVLIMNVVWPEMLAWSVIHVPTSIQWMGIGFSLVSLLFANWIHMSLGNNFAGALEIVLGQQLLTRGPYHSIRHPLYLAHSAFLICISVSTASVCVLCLAITGIVLMRFMIIPREEAALIDRFQNRYRSYMSRTGIWFPRLGRRRRRHSVRFQNTNSQVKTYR